jgi:hypothetical protein
MDPDWIFDKEKTREKLSLILDQADRMTHIMHPVRLFAQGAD